MKFDGRADVRGFLKKFSSSLTRSSKKSVEARDNEDEEVHLTSLADTYLVA